MGRSSIGVGFVVDGVGYRASAGGEDPPVTAVATRRVKPGREAEFEAWVSGILQEANGFAGYMGSDVLKPGTPDEEEYRIVFRFDHESNLKRWEESDERHRWLDEVGPLVHEQNVQVLTGLETWFTLASKAGEPAPPRYKMAAVTWLAVFPLATTLFILLQPLLGGAPTVLRTLVFTLIMVTTMTYVVMPRMTRLFSGWLYPKK